MIGGLGLVWLAAIASTLYQVGEYQSTPGAAAKTDDRWPADALVQRDERLPTLLLFAHPQCPCTSATVEELDRLLGSREGRLAVQVVFYSDPALGPGWTQDALWSRTARIPGVALHEDPLGAEAQRFGVSTSGQVLLFAPDGRLLFQGGITASRGHEGDNLGRESILALLDGRPAPHSSPVFGCSLTARDSP